METKNVVISLAVAGLIILVIGFGVGAFYQTQVQLAKNPALKKAIAIEPTVNILTSKTIQSIMAYGQVEKISANNITLSYAGDKITVAVKSSAQIYSSIAVKDSKTGNLATGAPQLVKFSDIKTGQGISVTLKILPTGQMEADSVYILAASSVTK